MAKVKVDPIESPEIVTWILKHIVEAVKAPNAKYTVIPGIRYFRAIESVPNEQSEHSYKIEHIPPQKRCEVDQVYAYFDNFEVLCSLSFAQGHFFTLENHINKNYVYDINSDTYVLRPHTPNIWEITKQFINSRKR